MFLQYLSAAQPMLIWLIPYDKSTRPQIRKKALRRGLGTLNQHLTARNAQWYLSIA